MRQVKLASLKNLIEQGCINIQTGPFGTQLKAADYKNEGIPVINVRNIGYRNEKDAELEYLNEKDAHRLRQHKLEEKDIAFGRKGAVDRHLFIKKKQNGWIQGSDCIRIRINADKLNPDFLSFFFLTDGHKKWMEAQGAFGATMGSLNQGIIQRIFYPDFPLPIQCKIAAVLSAYDDLIENNNRCIAILEKMAKELYREWFVRLRFPGHEKTKIIKGMPESWEVKKIKEVVERKSFGGIYRESDLQLTGKIIVIDQSTNEYLGFYDGEPEHYATEEKPIILFGDHSCKMQIMIEPFSLAENVIPFVAKGQMPTAFLFYMIHNSIETTEYKRHWTDLINKEVYIPKEELQIDFAKIATAHIHQKEKLIAANRKIKIIRDGLLSRLMSGKIDVEHLDIQFPAGMKEEVNANA